MRRPEARRRPGRKRVERASVAPRANPEGRRSRTARPRVLDWRGALIVLAILAATARPTPAPEASPGASSEDRDDFTKVAASILCYCGCARQTVLDCTCGVAFQLRDQLEAGLRSGASPESLVEGYVAEHGEQARTVPPKTGLNLLAWFGPGVAILLAAAGTIAVILVWSARGRSSGATPAAAAEAEDLDGVRARMEKELKEFDA